MSEDHPLSDPLTELRFALAEGDAEDAPRDLRSRVMAAAAAAREPMAPLDPPAHISGAEAFRRTVVRLDGLLTELGPDEWSLHALRDLDVQGLVGHLIGVEEHFGSALAGAPDRASDGASDGAGDDHVGTTQPAAVRQAGRDTTATHREWFERATQTLAAVADLEPPTTITFYGVTLPVDLLLVIRSFEMWTHEEDIRRATGRGLADPEPETLARLIALATALLPAGVARAGRAQPEKSVRLVLTGPGGGTFDLSLDGSPVEGRAGSRIVVDATEFCRVVGNRADESTVDAIVTGDAATASDLFAGAAALALD